MTEIARIENKPSASSSDWNRRGGADSFSSIIALEQADSLLKETGQYSRWQHIRQNNDQMARHLAQIVLHRHKIVTSWQNGEVIDPTPFNKLTEELKKNSINLYTFDQLQKNVKRSAIETNTRIRIQDLKIDTHTPESNKLLVQADHLLRKTRQYEQWKHILQNNDKKAHRLAALLDERYQLLRAARQEKPIDRQRFNDITKRLHREEIYLYSFEELSFNTDPHVANRLTAKTKKTHSVAPQTPISTGQNPKAEFAPSQAEIYLSPPPEKPSETPVISLDQNATNVASQKRQATAIAPPVPTPHVPPALENTNNYVSPIIEPPSSSIPPVLSVENAQGLLTEENLLILDLKSKELDLNRPIFAYGDENLVMLPLSEMVKSLDFAIKVDLDKETANGWYINEKRVFSLNIEQKQVAIDGKQLPWQAGEVIIGDDDIYIDAKAFSSWFPVDHDFSMGELALTLTPREKLPYQLRMEREGKIGDLRDIPLKYPIKEMKYELFSIPVMDVTLNGGHDNDGPAGRYSLLSRGDLAFMNSYVYASGDENSPFDIARVRLERVEPENDILGPLHASKLVIGDILPTSFPVLPSNSPERGVSLSNTDLVHSGSFDSTQFEGTLSPGWEVELYHNNRFLFRQTIREDGRYLFDNVPVYYGKNNFQVISYGPQGQKELLEEKDLTVGSGMFPKGEGVYEFSASQYEHTILGIDEADTTVDNDQPRITGTYLHGLTDNLSAGVGLSSVEFDDERHNYLQARLSGNIWNAYMDLNLLQDTASGTGLSLSGQTALGAVNINATQEFFSDFVMEDNSNLHLQSQSELRLNGTIPESSATPPLSYTLASKYYNYTENDRADLSATLSGRFTDIYLSNRTEYHYGEQAEDEITNLFQASGNIGPVRTTGDLLYRHRFGDTSGVARFSLSGDWRIDKDLYAGVGASHQPESDGLTKIHAELDWDIGQAIVKPSISYDSEGNFNAFLGLSFSFGRDPVTEKWQITSQKSAEKGNVSSFVYHDANNNKIFDGEDTPLPEAKIESIQSYGKTVTDTNGSGLISGLQPYKATDIELDTDSLEDPFWMPSIEGVAIQPRPGHFDRIDFPVVTTGEIDGTVYLINADGENIGEAGLKLELVNDDNKIVREGYTEFDGFYLFEKVLPGEYTLRVSPQDVEEGHTSQEHRITIDTDGTIVDYKDIIIRDTRSKTNKESASDRADQSVLGPFPTPSPEASLHKNPPGSSVAEDSQETESLKRTPDKAFSSIGSSLQINKKVSHFEKIEKEPTTAAISEPGFPTHIHPPIIPTDTATIAEPIFPTLIHHPISSIDNSSQKVNQAIAAYRRQESAVG